MLQVRDSQAPSPAGRLIGAVCLIVHLHVRTIGRKIEPRTPLRVLIQEEEKRPGSGLRKVD